MYLKDCLNAIRTEIVFVCLSSVITSILIETIETDMLSCRYSDLTVLTNQVNKAAEYVHPIDRQKLKAINDTFYSLSVYCSLLHQACCDI